MNMIKKEYTVRFVTPAFIGNAEQQGAWRAPPFKALIRQWWRVVEASWVDYHYERLREEEGQLFGHAWLKAGTKKTWAMKSRVLVRLEHWNRGTLENWTQRDPKIRHPECNREVGAHLYLGYGPLTYQRGTNLKMKPAIRDGDFARLQLGFPFESEERLRSSLQLVHWFGALGSRSRNGWGSVELEGDGIAGYEDISPNNPIIKKISSPLPDCLQKEWPHALGKDDQGLLVWMTGRHDSWSQIVKILAIVKIDLRTKAFPFIRNQEANTPRIDERHILAYPVTHHGVEGWCETDSRGQLRRDRRGNLIQKERLANQLRLKIAQDGGKYFGIIYHLPCGLPGELLRRLGKQDKDWISAKENEIWRRVHRQLDSNSFISRKKEG